MQDNLMQQGVELMLFGMGTVFVFLVILIVVTSTMSAVVQRFFPDKPMAVSPVTNNAAATNDDQLIAVIGAAIHKFRSRHK